nr:hypothetical protein [Tanacetum cinerariifolium]
MRMCQGLMQKFKMKARVDQTLVILEEPASSTGTLSSLQHLAKDLSFSDLLFNDKPSEVDNEKITAETKAESMVSVTIQQDTSLIPSMTTPIINLTPRPDSHNVPRLLQATATKTTTTTTTTTTTHPPPPQPQQSTTDSMLKKVSKAMDEVVTYAVDWAIQAPLRNRFRDLPEADMKEILHQQMWETNSYKAHEDHMMLYEALEKSMNRDHTDELLKDLAKARRKKKKRRDSPKTPPGSPPYQPPPLPPPAGPSRTSGSLGASGSSKVPPSPLSTNQEGQSYGSTTPSSSKTAALAEYKAWTKTNTRLRPFVSLTPKDLHMDDDMALDAQVHSSDDEDIGNAYIPKVNLQQDWRKPLKEDRHVTPEPAWSIPSSDMYVPKNNWASSLASTYSPLPEDSLLGKTYQIEECHKLLTDSADDSIIRHNVSKPLPLGGPPGQVTIQSDIFFNKDLEYLRYGSQGNRPALSILNMKATYYPNVVLEQIVTPPDGAWTEYVSGGMTLLRISSTKHKERPLRVVTQMVLDQMWIEDEHTSEGDRRAVRTHMWILSVVRIEVFSMYGYDYMKKITLRRADLNEHVIAKRDFKYLYLSDFEDLYLLNLQGHLNHLPPKDKKILTTAVNLWTRHLVIRRRVKDFQLGIESYQTQLNLTKPQWDATGFEYTHDYTVIDSPRAITFRDKYGVQMIMRFNEIRKFSDGTLH